MGKPALVFALAMALSGAVLPLPAQEKNPVSAPAPTARDTSAVGVMRNRVFGYTAWDDEYFYVAVQVNKPSLKARNSEPYSNPLEDDAVIIALQTDNDHKTTKRTDHTFTAAISAAGGAQIYSGPRANPLFHGLSEFNDKLMEIAKITDPKDQEAKRVALLASALHCAATAKGAPTTGISNAAGYTIELAIPWVDIGGRPEPGARMGFEVAAQSVDPTAGSPALQSLMPGVNISSDLANPSLFGSILFSNAAGISSNSALVCPRVFTNRPVVDGELSSGEWNSMSSYEFGEVAGASGSGSGKEGVLARTLAARVRPEYVLRPPRPAVPLPAAVTSPASMPARHPQKAPSLVFACYDYRYQADTRKRAPTERVLRTNGETSLALHPIDGTGPWFSYDHADWHRHQLQDLRRAGVDVVLPIYRGTAHDRQLFSDKGIQNMVTALASLRDAGQDYPQVGLFLDTIAVDEILGSRPDLRDPAVQAGIYGEIRDFYRAIPAEFRCAIQLSQENGGRIAYPVFLSDGTAFQAVDKAFIAYVRGRFAADFNGADLVVLGSSDLKNAALDGYFNIAAAGGFQYNNDGWISTGTVAIGRKGRLTQLRPDEKPAESRMISDAFRGDLSKALEKRPAWILLPYWNDFAGGAVAAPTLEDGYSLVDMISIYSRLLIGSAPTAVRFLSCDAPSRMTGSANYAVQVRVQNIGTSPWGVPKQTAVGLGYRWIRGGAVLSEGSVVPFKTVVAPGQSSSVMLAGVVAPDARGGAADYTLEIGLTESEKQAHSIAWIGAETPGSVLSIPVRVEPAGDAASGRWAATLIQSDLPAVVESGSVYEVHATLRNDGDLAWRKADGARVTLRITRTAPGADFTIGDATTLESPIATADATADLPKDVAPGQEADVRLLVALQSPDGKPLPTWSQGDLWTYTTRWEVAVDGAHEHAAPGAAPTVDPPAHGALTAAAPISIVDFDFGVRFTADGTPSPLPAERRLPVRLGLQNVGPQIWKKNDVRVGYHWYYEDGTELLWEDETTPLNQDVPPGGQVNDFLAWVTAPPYDGAYYLVWDLKVGDTWASTSSATRCFDETVRLVQVTKGHLSFADLTAGFNLDGVTDEDNTGDGDFDGRGDSFPAAQVPPFTNMEVSPVGMWLPSAKTGPDSPRRISFRWGPKDPKSNNFIACRGQLYELGKSAGQCRVLHILAASTEQYMLTTIKLVFQEPTSRSEDMYAFEASPWDRPPTHGEEIAFVCYGHHNKSGLQPGAVALYHYAIRIKEPRKLVALSLPNSPEIKIAAITLEK